MAPPVHLSSSHNNSNSSFWRYLSTFLFLVIGIQWGLLTTVLVQKDGSSAVTVQDGKRGKEFSDDRVMQKKSPQSEILFDTTKSGESSAANEEYREEQDPFVMTNSTTKNHPVGVFATVIFRAPKWMHLRYKLMIDNALANLPSPEWKLQVFLNRPWVEKEIVPWHRGWERLVQDPRVTTVDLPPELLKGKPKHVLSSKWFWETGIQAEHVVLFAANGAFCGNRFDPQGDLWEYLVQQTDIAYCGAPWSQGPGGEGGTHSFRRRSAMLQALEFAQHEKIDPDSFGPEYKFFTSMIERLSKRKDGVPLRLATVNETLRFAGVEQLSSDTGLERLPAVVSGTHARLSWAQRDSLLKHCPELKMIFPSLHEPSCFGAHPKGEQCKATICALQDNIPKHGC